MRRRAPAWLAVLLSAAFLVASCSGDDGVEATDDAAGGSSTTGTPTTDTTGPSSSVPTFTGDPASPFCDAIREQAERPVLDPFEAGIDAPEVELRMRNLLVRFDELVRTGPDELAGDLDEVAAGLRELDSVLAEHDHDLAAARAAGVDASVFDSAEYGEIAVRLAAYREQVCTG